MTINAAKLAGKIAQEEFEEHLRSNICTAERQGLYLEDTVRTEEVHWKTTLTY